MNTALAPGYPFVLHEFHWAAADIFGYLLEGIGLGDPFGHDESHRRIILAERQQHLRIGFLEYPFEGAVVDRRQLLLKSDEHLAHGIAHRPAGKARHCVLRQHRLAIMKFEARPQAEGPGQAVRRNLFGLHHLALRLQPVVEAIERVPHHGRRIAHDVLRAPDRVEVGEVGLGHETERACGGALRKGRCRKFSERRGSSRASCGFQECPAMHGVCLLGRV
jgi:hypothetical protein